MKFHAKLMQNRAAKVKMIQKRASQGFLDPIQKHALSRFYSLRPCISRPYCTWNIRRLVNDLFVPSSK